MSPMISNAASGYRVPTLIKFAVPSYFHWHDGKGNDIEPVPAHDELYPCNLV